MATPNAYASCVHTRINNGGDYVSVCTYRNCRVEGEYVWANAGRCSGATYYSRYFHEHGNVNDPWYYY